MPPSPPRGTLYHPFPSCYGERVTTPGVSPVTCHLVLRTGRDSADGTEIRHQLTLSSSKGDLPGWAWRTGERGRTRSAETGQTATECGGHVAGNRHPTTEMAPAVSNLGPNARNRTPLQPASVEGGPGPRMRPQPQLAP